MVIETNKDRMYAFEIAKLYYFLSTFTRTVICYAMLKVSLHFPNRVWKVFQLFAICFLYYLHLISDILFHINILVN